MRAVRLPMSYLLAYDGDTRFSWSVYSQVKENIHMTKFSSQHEVQVLECWTFTG